MVVKAIAKVPLFCKEFAWISVAKSPIFVVSEFKIFAVTVPMTSLTLLKVVAKVVNSTTFTGDDICCPNSVLTVLILRLAAGVTAVIDVVVVVVLAVEAVVKSTTELVTLASKVFSVLAKIVVDTVAIDDGVPIAKGDIVVVVRGCSSILNVGAKANDFVMLEAVEATKVAVELPGNRLLTVAANVSSVVVVVVANVLPSPIEPNCSVAGINAVRAGDTVGFSLVLLYSIAKGTIVLRSV